MTNYHYICFDCAKEHGGHDASIGSTLHEAECNKCGKTATLGHVMDYGLNTELVFRDLKPLD